MSEETFGLVKKARARYKKLNSLVGRQVPDSPNEKLELWKSYPLELAKFNGDYWDIPEYTNGSTRRAQCLFLLGMNHTGDGTYPYLGSREEIDELLANSEREKILSAQTIDDVSVEVIWSYDIAPPERYGQWYYTIDDFWLGVRFNGALVEKFHGIAGLFIPKLVQRCYACEREKSVLYLEKYKTKWMCRSESKLPYERCPE